MKEQKEILDDLDFSKESAGLFNKGNTVVPLLQFIASLFALSSFVVSVSLVIFKGPINWYGSNRFLDEALLVFYFAFPTSLVLAFLGFLLKEPKTWYGTAGFRICLALLFSVVALVSLIILEVGFFK